MSRQKARCSLDVAQLTYQPQAGYPFDLEVLVFSELRLRAGAELLELAHRYAFSTLIGVTQGTCTHRVDFEFVRCEPGAVVVLTPGMAHSFGPSADWEGWVVAFRPEFAWPAVTASAPERGSRMLRRRGGVVRLMPQEMLALTRSVMQMREDANLRDSPQHVHALLRHQLHSTLARIHMVNERNEMQLLPSRRDGGRFRQFEALVEEKYRAWHQVSNYSNAIGCSERTLTRSTLEGAGMTPKAFISARLILEAKRLLAHTELKVLEVAEHLCFSDTPNFIKFFQREVGCTPSTFRQRQLQTV